MALWVAGWGGGCVIWVVMPSLSDDGLGDGLLECPLFLLLFLSVLYILMKKATSKKTNY